MGAIAITLPRLDTAIGDMDITLALHGNAGLSVPIKKAELDKRCIARAYGKLRDSSGKART